MRDYTARLLRLKNQGIFFYILLNLGRNVARDMSQAQTCRISEEFDFFAFSIGFVVSCFITLQICSYFFGFLPFCHAQGNGLSPKCAAGHLGLGLGWTNWWTNWWTNHVWMLCLRSSLLNEFSALEGLDTDTHPWKSLKSQEHKQSSSDFNDFKKKYCYNIYL